MNQSQALTIMKTGSNVFLTGEPGSGKTHIINEYVSYLRSCGIEVAITASTGIAATHIGGMTIHSWSGVGIKSELSRHEIDKIANNKPVAKRINPAKVLIIDEISMLPPKTLNMVEAICRRAKQNPNPFGGIQVIFVGDFFQLPPIMKNDRGNRQSTLLEKPIEKFAYDSSAWKTTDPLVCYLEEQYRQDDKEYLDLLSAIRAKKFNNNFITHLEKRKISYDQTPDGLPKLFSHNIDVDRVNDEMLEKLPGESKSFSMTGYGIKKVVDTLKRGCLSPEVLRLKIGASVMFTKNNPKGLFVNGTLGKIEGFDPTNDHPIVVTRDGKRITVNTADWVLEENGEDIARITQFPLRLAWAITVHKSQGMSLDGAVMDLSSVFEFGQGYVALSRVRRLSGLHLLGWNKRAFEIHPDVADKDDEFKIASKSGADTFSKISTKKTLESHKIFVSSCGGRIGLTPLKKRVDFYPLKEAKLDTYNETLKLWIENKSIREIAKLRNLKKSTIISHLEKLIERGKIKPRDTLKLLSPRLIKVAPEIHQAFQRLGTEKLGPIFENFKGKHSYEDLRLIRMTLEKK